MSHQWVGTRVAKLPQEKLEELCAMTPEELEVRLSLSHSIEEINSISDR